MKIQVHGETTQLPPPRANGAIRVEVKEAVKVASHRGQARPVEIEMAAGEVLELQVAMGPNLGALPLWIPAEEVPERLAASALATRSTEEGDLLILSQRLVVPAAPDDSGTRGGTSLLIEKVSVLKVSGDVGQAAADFEEGQGPKGLRMWSRDGSFGPAAFPAELPAHAPWLLFVHGTASTTEGSFGRFQNDHKDLWRQLHQHYPGRVLAFDHRSLTQDPVRNVADLLTALPDGIELHLVTHSRGGLVGEVLSSASVIGGDSAPFNGSDVPGLEDLGQKLVARKISVSRFVRVACPARGTSLAGGRLDRWLNLFFGILKIAAIGKSDERQAQIDGLHDLALAASAAPGDPAALPGIAAMAPGQSKLLAALNQPRDTAGNDGLVVLGGDSQPEGITQRITLWFADAFFGHENDLVVDTASMDGGLPRAKNQHVPIFIDTGRRVTHFNYFANDATAQRLLVALRDPTALEGTTRSTDQQLATAEGERRGDVSDVALANGSTLPTPGLSRGRGKPLALILPGVTGSHLYNGDTHIWINPAGFCLSGVKALDIGNRNIRPRRLIETYYGGLRRHLSRSHEVVPLAYDWRLPIQTTGGFLAGMLDRWLTEDPMRPVQIVGHSMGGLVARMALASSTRLMERFLDRPESRLLMLGTPNGGSLSMAQLLLGRSALIKAADFISPGETLEDLIRIVGQWPGAVQLLPQDMLNPVKWLALPGAIAPHADSRKEAETFWQKMRSDAGIPRDRCVYLAGAGRTCDRIFTVKTPRGLEIRMSYTNAGDGTVLWASGIPKDVPAWFGQAQHGDLPATRALWPAIADLLLSGTTDALPRQPGRRDAETMPATRQVEREETLAMIPSSSQLLAMAMGGRPPRMTGRGDAPEKVRIRVVHGDLTYARFPILVGHSVGDAISGSEAALDRALGGRLSRRMARGLHPGQIGTWDVALTPKAGGGGTGFAGGVTVGMGVLSDLNRGQLIETLRCGLMAYADTADELQADQDRRAPLALSMVLLGCGIGVLSVSDSIAAMLEAVDQANKLLDSPSGQTGGETPRESPRFAEIEVIEVVEQTAVTAWYAARNRVDRLASRFHLLGPLEEGRGGWRRTGPEVDADRWMEVTITAPGAASPEDDGALHYLLVDGRARVEAEVVSTSRRLVQHFISQIPVQGGAVDPKGTSPGRTLFELLWPARLKGFSLDDRNLRLVLDRASAAIPWEMLDDRRPGDDDFQQSVMENLRPPAVRFGVLRQLMSQRNRQTPARRGGRLRALVIGDPRGGGSPLIELPGAQEEARAIAALLSGDGYEVTAMIGDEAKPAEVVSMLFSRPWDVIHVAGHGVVNWQSPGSHSERTGIVLGGPPLDVLEAGMLSQLSVPPELVFINCCHLGAIPETDIHLRRDRAGLASSIAVELIESGASAVVACGWAVDDSTALSFAQTFYRALCEGQTYGHAVRAARLAAYELSGMAGFNDVTWGAYQCYGHPGFAVKQRADGVWAPNLDLASPEEAISMLRGMCSQASARSDAVRQPDRDAEAELRQQDEQVKALHELAAKIDDLEWNYRSDLVSALGDAWVSCDRLDEAIAAYRQAAGARELNLPVRALQACFGLALQSAADKPDEGSLKQGLQVFEALNAACGDSVERLELIALLQLRLVVAGAVAAKSGLRDMFKTLSRVLQLAMTENRNDLLDLRLRLVLVSALTKSRKRDTLLAEITECRASHDGVLSASCDLVEAVVTNKSAEIDALAKNLKNSGSPVDTDSGLLDLVNLTLACLPARARLRKPLEALLKELCPG